MNGFWSKEEESLDLTESSLPRSIHLYIIDANSQILKNAYKHASEKIALDEVRFSINQILRIFTSINVLVVV